MSIFIILINLLILLFTVKPLLWRYKMTQFLSQNIKTKK